jgi:uncharacterized protein
MTSADYVELSGTFDELGRRSPCALTLPARQGEAQRDVSSAILLIPGSLFSDVNGDYPSWNMFPHVYAHLARQLSARGHAVYRYAKAGPGTGTIEIDQDVAWKNRTWASRLIIARAALRDMQRWLAAERVRYSSTVLAGHSEGAVVATQLGQEFKADGVVLLSGPSVGILSIMREQVGFFIQPDDIEQARSDLDEAIAALRRDGSLSDELKSRPAVRGLASMDTVGWRYMLDCEDTDPSSGAAALEMPVLIVQGGRDGSVKPHHADRLRAARDRVRGRETRVAFFPELQHMYKRIPEGTPPMQEFGLPGETDPRVTDAIDDWIASLTAAV